MNIAVILSGGTGSRMGAKIPKQYIEVQGRPVIEHCLDQFSACEAVDAVQIVADSAWHRYIRDRMEEGLTKDFPCQERIVSSLFFMPWKIFFCMPLLMIM